MPSWRFGVISDYIPGREGGGGGDTIGCVMLCRQLVADADQSGQTLDYVKLPASKMEESS